MKKKGLIFFSSKYINVLISDNKKIEKFNFELNDFSAETISELLKNIKKTEVLAVLSGELYYNLKTEVQITNIDSLNKILPNIISGYHFEKNYKGGFGVAVYNADNSSRTVLYSYLTEEKKYIISGALKNFKVSGITSMHHFLYEYLKKNSVSPEKIKVQDFYFNNDNLFYGFTIDSQNKLSMIKNVKIKKEDLPENGNGCVVLNGPESLFEDFSKREMLDSVYNSIIENYKFTLFEKKNRVKLSDVFDLKKCFNKTSVYLLIVILLFYELNRYLIYHKFKTQYNGVKSNQVKLFKNNFSQEKVIIDPLNQSKSLMLKKKNELEMMYKNSPLYIDYIRQLNQSFDILNKYSAQLKQVDVKNNVITFEGEAQSISDIDKIHSELREKLRNVESVKILNSKYKNILSNTGAEFEISIVIELPKITDGN
ncbi:hypothetical protein KA977_09075 [Candidatus Dependentiae bacterium]|nr:hypothetical protein [Candidatus Dependentiae bacterium]